MRTATLVLKARSKIISGAEAWVEIDGVKEANWTVGTDEVRLTVAAGRREVAVYSIYQGARRQIYREFIELSSGETKTVSGL